MIFAGTTITWEETCILAFLASTRQQPHKVSPKTAGNYLSAVRKFLQNGGIDTTFMGTSQYIRNTKASMRIAYRIETGITDKDTLRLPVSLDMILGNHRVTRKKATYTIVDLTVYTAEILAYTTLSRVSEYLETGERGAHTLKTTDVLFELQNGSIIPAHQTSSTKFASVAGCLINIKSAKNDPTGRGHRYYFQTSNPKDETQYCITWTLWRYAETAKPSPDKPFFHVPTLQWTLKPRYLNKKLKEMAYEYGLDPTRVSSHSLRIAGATAMAAAGMHEYEIKQMGGWKSDVFLDYARSSTEAFARARVTLARPLTTIQSTKLLHPGCNTTTQIKEQTGCISTSRLFTQN